MLAVIKGDIINSRKMESSELWLKPLKRLFSTWGKEPEHWEFIWGDTFQLEINSVDQALLAAFLIKSEIKQVASTRERNNRRSSKIDVRMSIGIGEKSFSAERISESYGTAFINAGEKFEDLKKEKTTLLLKSPWEEFDRTFNLYLSLVGVIMDKWTINSAELAKIVLLNPQRTQKEIGELLGINQSSVSSRWEIAKISEILKVEKMYTYLLTQYLQP